MPAMLDDPTAPPIYRVSGMLPHAVPGQSTLPYDIHPRQVTLRDRTTIATLVPFSNASQVSPRLLEFLCDLLNSEIEKGDTYPMINPMPLSSFGTYWFQNFGAIMVLGEVSSAEEIAMMEARGTEWKDYCLGSFYIKPNYPGRSSHVCNAGFLVSNASRNRGVGKLMGEGYLDWAPKLGYIYSVFNLVYETNHASIRIWDSLGFKRIGRVKGCGALKSHPGTLVDAIIYGRDLGPESEDFVSEERFDKIRYYLKHQKYPIGADRAEKSRLRSAATHYHLLPGAPGDEERLMLKDKEVVADPQKQYEIARQMHCQSHGGINKTTATIAEKYHWVRIKETVSLVIKNCPECKESNKAPNNYNGKPEILSSSPGKPGSNLNSSKTPPSASTGREVTPPKANMHMRQTPSTPNFDSPMHTPLHSTPLTTPLHTPMPAAPPMSRTSSAIPQTPINSQRSRSGPTAVQMATPQPLHPLPQPPLRNQHQHPQQHQQQHEVAMHQAQILQSPMQQNLILPTLNNHLGIASANVTPASSAIHSPMSKGPASAPITSMDNAFEMPLDPNLLASIQNDAYSDLTPGALDNTIQGIDNIGMDTNMHGMEDLNAMGLGEASMHGMADHDQVGHTEAQSGGIGMSEMDGEQGPGNVMVVHQNPHEHQQMKHEMSGLREGMVLDNNMLERPPNMG